jgi:hypothetical protein
MQVRLGFAASASGTVTEILLSEPVSRAWDIRTAGGVPPQKAAGMAAAAEWSGRDSVAFAEHFVRLRESVRAEPGG